MKDSFYQTIRQSFVKEVSPFLRQIFVYSTTRCNSRCNTCNIFKKDRQDLCLDSFESVVQFSSRRDDSIIFLEGGEVFLHPNYKDMLRMLRDVEYCIVSNGQFPNRIAEAAESFGIKRISFSLDGPKETYQKVRGIDGFDNLMQTIDLLKGQTDIHINSTISPWNGYEDLKWVSKFCSDNGFKHAIQPMYPINFFDTNKCNIFDYYFDVSDFLENTSFIGNTLDYFKGDVYLPCLNVRETIVVYPNGDIPLCHMRDGEILGNLKKTSLEAIVSNEKNIEIQNQCVSCNRCWLNCQRIIDVKLFEYLESKYPHEKLEREFGPFKWPIHGKLS